MLCVGVSDQMLKTVIGAISSLSDSEFCRITRILVVNRHCQKYVTLLVSGAMQFSACVALPLGVGYLAVSSGRIMSTFNVVMPACSVDVL